MALTALLHRLRCPVTRHPPVELNRRLLLLRWAGWFWFFTATLALLIGLKYSLVAGLPADLDSGLFFGVQTLGHWYSLAWLVTLLIFYPLILLVPSARLVGYLGLLLAMVLLLLLVVDVMAFSLFRFHLNGLVFSLVFGGAGGEIFVFDASVYLTALLIALVVASAVRVSGCIAWRLATRTRHPWLGAGVGLVLFACFITQSFWFAWADASGDVAITSRARLYPGYLPVRAESYLRDWGLVDGTKRQQRVSLGHGAANYPKAALACKSAGDTPPIFLITIDSWRADALTEKAAPHLSAFAREALHFEHHYSGGNNTRTGIFSLFYGLPATYWETFLDERIGSALVNQLVANKYEMAIYASAKLSSPEFDRTVFAAVDKLRTQTESDTVYARDLRANQEFVAHLQHYDGSKPLFGFLFYDAPHSNAYAEEFKGYFSPAAEGINYWSLGNDTDPEPIRNLYLNAVRSVDELVGESFAAIKAAGLWDDAIIIVTGDHGQELNDNGLGFWGHNGNFTDAQLHVPLLVKWPGHPAGHVSYPTTHYDVSTTLLSEALGCHNPTSDYSLGHSLFADDPRFGFVVGGFGDFGVRLAEQIYWIDKYGGIQVMSADNRLLSQPPEAATVSKAVAQTSEFFH